MAETGGGRTMNKKLGISLVAVLAVAALATMPAASQAACTPPACPHLYKNGGISTEGKKLRIIGWGTLKLTNPTLGEVECHNVGAGYAENPVGGGTAVGKSQAYADYECESAHCASLGGKAIESTAEGLPWTEELIEPEAGVFRIKIGKKGKEPGSIIVKTNCVGVFSETFFGELKPKILNNGFSIGSGPGEAEFDAGAGELESQIFGAGKSAGKLKGEGYAAEELIEIKNP
jgi:hypothetical protein